MQFGEFRTAKPYRTVLFRSSANPTEILYSPVAGEALFEGDIVLGTIAEVEQRYREFILQGLSEFDDTAVPLAQETAEIVTRARAIAIRRSVEDRGTGRLRTTRWAGGTIPYAITSDLTSPDRVREAIDHWQSHTTIRFMKRKNEADFVTFRPGNGCSSSVGRVGGQQFITLSSYCSTGNVIHEIGHTVGLWHEQSRSDRDFFVEMRWENIAADALHNFQQHVTDGDDIGDYDYGSIMHYPPSAFALDASKPTIVARNGAPIGQRRRLSASDIAAVNAIYAADAESLQ